MKTSTIASHYVRAAIAGAVSQGHDAQAILQKAGIAVEILHQTKARIYPEKMSKLLRIIAHLVQDEFLGQDTKTSTHGSFETLCNLILPCSTLREALTMGTAYYKLFDFAIHTNFEENSHSAFLTSNQDKPCLNQDNFLTEYQLVLWHRIACWLTGKRIPIKLAEFSYPKPDHADEYQLLFYGPQRFGQARTQLSFDLSHLDLPIIRSRDDLPELMKEAPYVFLVKPNNTASINAQICRILQNNLDAEMPDFESVAFQLNTSTQTLRRRLKDEDTSFQAIKDQVRRDLAIYYLSDNKLSINDIALKVGFTEPSTFHRAFKKWTGVTPGDYRIEKNIRKHPIPA